MRLPFMPKPETIEYAGKSKSPLFAGAWFCMTNYFGQVSNAHEHPDWRVGFPIGNYAPLVLLAKFLEVPAPIVA